MAPAKKPKRCSGPKKVKQEEERTCLRHYGSNIRHESRGH